jgi:sigma-E factor negative regulatory protein RseA
MTKQYEEQLSSFMDGELDHTSHEQIIKNISSDQQLKNRWERYHLISDSLKNNLPASLQFDFADSVMSAVEAEPTVLAPQTQRVGQPSERMPAPLMKRVAGFAIAASVATIAVIGVQTQYESEAPEQIAEMPSSRDFVRIQNEPQVAVLPSLNAPITKDGFTTASSVQQRALGFAIQNPQKSEPNVVEFNPQLHKYIVNHHQHVSGTRVQGLIPYARIVSSSQSAAQSQVQR